MKLPRELRDMVYGYLLCPQIDGKVSWYYELPQDHGLEPAILRTCRQIYDEASRILYTKNSVFIIHMDVSQTSHVMDEEWPIAEVEYGEIGGVPVLTMNVSAKSRPAPNELATRSSARVLRMRTTKEPARVSTLPDKRKKARKPSEEQAMYIGFLPALSKICKQMVAWDSIRALQVTIRMERPIEIPPERYEKIQVDCLERLCEARGFGRASILADPHDSASAASTAKLMTTSIGSIEDVLSQAVTYETRVSRQMKNKQWDEARDTLENALAFFNEHRDLPSLTKNARRELAKRDKSMKWKHISCCLKVGRTGDVYTQLRFMFGFITSITSKHTGPMRRNHLAHVADAQCAIGKACIIDGALNSALFSFSQALLVMPGHAETEQALEQLKARLSSDSKPEHAAAKRNLDRIAEKVRRIASNERCMIGEQSEKLYRNYKATLRRLENND